MPAFTEPRAKSDESAEPIWAGSLLPVIAALIFGILVGNGAVYLLLPQAMRNVVSAGLGAADAEAQGRLIAFAIVAVSCSLGAAACLMLDLARRHMREHAAALQVARARDMFDSLTGALHRRRFKERLDMSLAGAPAGAFVTLHLIDIEGFSGINDQHGQEAGDTVLRTTAARLAGQAFADQIVGRLGADVFALAVFSATPPLADGDAATLNALLTRPVQHRDIAITLRVGIGTRIAPALGASTDTLLDQAELALREARRGGARNALVYSEDLAIAVQERRALEKRLIDASLAEDGFQVHYQPICHAADGRLWGYEALVRLPAGDGLPAVSPDVFIPVAERLGLIPAIGRRVIREAIAEAARWPDGIVVSINLSALQFAAEVADDLLAVTREALTTYGLAPSRLVYEITEGRHLQAAPEVLADLQTLKEMGVGRALDDFGTGYSTLAYLWAFPFDKLKIDASFVRALANGDGHAHTVLATVIRLGHALGLMVTAEGVETEHQAQYLRLLGCDLLQGYLYGRPTTADATEAELARRMPAPISIPVAAKRAAAG